MGIQVEFNPDLALRHISEFKLGNRKIEECIPEDLMAGKTYSFIKQGQRNYWLRGLIPLVDMQGEEALSRPKASIIILKATHFVENGILYTKGIYTVVEVFSDDVIHFGCFDSVGIRT